MIDCAALYNFDPSTPFCDLSKWLLLQRFYIFKRTTLSSKFISLIKWFKWNINIYILNILDLDKCLSLKHTHTNKLDKYDHDRIRS